MFFKPIEMPAWQWRTTVRALLRVDIYGHEQGGFKHKGLKDLVTDMEERQKARHVMVDAHRAAGTLTTGHANGLFGGHQCGTGESGEATYTCLQILSVAKRAIDTLIIA
jgi:hypothetical protein